MIFMRSPLGSRFQAVSYSDIADFLGSLLFTWLIVQNCELFKLIGLICTPANHMGMGFNP